MLDQSAAKLSFARHVTPSRLADPVAAAITGAMLDGTIKPGDALPSEAEIARDFGVSKAIAREAFRQLASSGLVQTQQGKVARAKALSGEPFDRIFGVIARSSLDRLREANEMRRAFETGIVRLAAERRTVAGQEAMERAVGQMRASGEKAEAFTEADIDFHQGLALATGNVLIRVQVEGLRSVHHQVSSLFCSRPSRTHADWVATTRRHQAILLAVGAGDVDAAELAIRHHYEAAEIASIEVASKARMEAP